MPALQQVSLPPLHLYEPDSTWLRQVDNDYLTLLSSAAVYTAQATLQQHQERVHPPRSMSKDLVCALCPMTFLHFRMRCVDKWLFSEAFQQMFRSTRASTIRLDLDISLSLLPRNSHNRMRSCL